MDPLRGASESMAELFLDARCESFANTHKPPNQKAAGAALAAFVAHVDAATEVAEEGSNEWPAEEALCTSPRDLIEGNGTSALWQDREAVGWGPFLLLYLMPYIRTGGGTNAGAQRNRRARVSHARNASV
eukprot:CAMPEP_0182587780 /NCGR_PEP_ID=MMETSP1324-20130603/65776_1 /TAXON_ID=236786 /ORGANISM="Florenciella sp., Strain RCC1587" /LENGTH=129 /DNA_ID=CAMNT_0024804799 /DNA_START=32 /DNA_END=418 /DNA_ORIENTATION=-